MKTVKNRAVAALTVLLMITTALPLNAQELIPEEHGSEDETIEYQVPEEEKAPESGSVIQNDGLMYQTLSDDVGLTFTEVPEGFYNDDLIESYSGDSVEADDSQAYNDSYWDKFSNYYYYNLLNAKQKKFYDSADAACLKVLQGSADYKQVAATSTDGTYTWYVLPTVSFSGLSESEMQDVFWLFYYNNPQYYFVDNNIRWSGTTLYMMCGQEFHLGADRTSITASMKSQLDSWMNEVNAGTTQVEKEKIAHDIISRDVVYRQNQHSQSSYSAVVLHISVCVGYAKTLSMLLNAAGIDCAVVNSETHAWNIVRINGTWYYIDPTWDDQTWGTIYTYFNRSSAKMSDSDHTPKAFCKPYLPTLTADSGGSAEDTAAALGTAAKPKDTQTKSGTGYSISLSADSGAKIWYTTDKTDPGSTYSKSTLYSGAITAKKGAVIKARAERPGYNDSPIVTITAGTQTPTDPDPDPDPTVETKVTGISVNKTTATVRVGDTVTLTSTITPSTADETYVDWSYNTSETGVINNFSTSVSSNSPNSTCSFLAEKTGTVWITVTSRDGGYTAYSTITVVDSSTPIEDPTDGVKVTSVTVNTSSVSASVGDTVYLNSTVYPLDADNPMVDWSYTESVPGVINNWSTSVSSNSPYSTCSFLAQKAGTVYFTVTSRDGGYTAYCSVTVTGSVPTPGPIDPDPYTGDLTTWAVYENLDGATLGVSLEHTSSTVYDGRKHVVKAIGTKVTAESASVNPDITIQNFSVTLNGTELSGITLSSVSYKNNLMPSHDGLTDQTMTMGLGLKYDSKDMYLKDILKTYPKLKTVLNKMVKPAYNKKYGTWTYSPISVEIDRITISETTPVYTVGNLKENPSLKYADNVLVWNGGENNAQLAKNIQMLVAKYALYATLVNYKGLYYQRAFNLPNGKIAVKKIPLKAGMWNVISRTYTSGGKKYSAYFDMYLKTKSFDYCPPKEYSAQPGRVADVIFNDESAGFTGVKRGNFTGTMPELF